MVPPSPTSVETTSRCQPGERGLPADCCGFGSPLACGGNLQGGALDARRSAPLFLNPEFAVWPCAKFLCVHRICAPRGVGLSLLPGADLAPSFLHPVLVPGQRAGIQDTAQVPSWLESQGEPGGPPPRQQGLRPSSAGWPAPFFTRDRWWVCSLGAVNHTAAQAHTWYTRACTHVQYR